MYTILLCSTAQFVCLGPARYELLQVYSTYKHGPATADVPPGRVWRLYMQDKTLEDKIREENSANAHVRAEN